MITDFTMQLDELEITLGKHTVMMTDVYEVTIQVSTWPRAFEGSAHSVCRGDFQVTDVVQLSYGKRRRELGDDPMDRAVFAGIVRSLDERAVQRAYEAARQEWADSRQDRIADARRDLAKHAA